MAIMRNNGEGSSNGTNGNPDFTQLVQAFIAALNANRPPPNNQHWRRNDSKQGSSKNSGRGSTIVRCYNCSSIGHFNRNCPHPRKEETNTKVIRQGNSSGGPIKTVHNNNDRGPYLAKLNPAQINTQPWKRGDRRQGPSGSTHNNPTIRCFKCQAFGHISRNCSRTVGPIDYGYLQPQQYQQIDFANPSFGKQPMQQNTRPEKKACRECISLECSE